MKSCVSLFLAGLALSLVAFCVTTVSAAVAPEAPAPLWDGEESIADYARRVGLPLTQTLTVGKERVPLEMTLIPAGNNTARRLSVAKPFYMGVSHVTVDQFTAFFNTTGYKTDAEKKGGALVLEVRGGAYVATMTPGASWRKPGFPQEGNHPVVQVSFNDAKAFADSMSKRLHKKVGLPSPTQWEYAARAGTKSNYIWGDRLENGNLYANLSDLSLKRNVPGLTAWESFNWDDKFTYTAPIKSFLPNAFGLYDMSGNAWQRIGDGTLRGTSWNSRSHTLVLTHVGTYPADHAYGVGGFRVMMEVDDAK